MNQESGPNDIGRQLGEDGVNGVVVKVEQYCTHAVRHIELENRAPMFMLRAEYTQLAKQAESIEEQLRSAPLPGDMRHFRRKKIFAWVVAGLLTVTGFFLAVLTFAPFQLGWQSYAFSIGIAIVVPFLMEELFDGGRLDALITPLTVVAIIAGMASLMLMAHVRGNLLKREVQAPPAVVIDDAQPEQPAQQEDFYGKSTDLLTLATVLLSLAMELGAGLAMRRAWAKAPHNAEDYVRLRNELAGIQGRMIVIGGKATFLEAQPELFEAGLWRDFYKSMLIHTAQSAMRKLLVGLVALSFVSHAHAADTAKPLDLVIALDLTRSTDVKGPDGKTEFQKNVEGVTGVLAQVPAGSHVTVIGITDRSFAQPYILLSASVPDDPGYFGDRLVAAHRSLIHAWTARSARLQPIFPATDILGAMELVGQIFDQHRMPSERRVLVLFSDMRNHTKQGDLETERGISVATEQQIRTPLRPIDLHHVKIFALGVDGAGSTMAEWQAIATYWRKLVYNDGATLETFSPLRQLSLVTIK